VVEQFKILNKIRKKYNLKKIKFGKDFEFFPKIFESKKSWDADKFEEFIEENKIIILTLQGGILKNNKATQDIFVRMLDDALQRQEFALIASKYYPIIDLLINAILTKDKDEFFQALFMMKELHKKCMELETKISRKLTKIIGERIKMTEEDYNAMLK
jgi:short-subunit dehydrogenase involved in D-alanine esterification of teichoic acids